MKKKSVIVMVLMLSLLLCACGGGSSGIKTKWYMTDDDDFWMEISDSSIKFYSVHDDELGVTADASISDSELVISNRNKITKGARSLSEGTYSYTINGDTLTLSKGGDAMTFSTDISYKRDH